MYAIHYHVRSEGQIVKKTVYVAMPDWPDTKIGMSMVRMNVGWRLRP